MPTYNIKFEFFGKKMQTNIKAKNTDEAKQKLLNRVHIHSVNMTDTDKGDDFLDILNFFQNIY